MTSILTSKRGKNIIKVAKALEASTDYLLTGDIVDKDMLILADKLRSLSPKMLRIVENIIDECTKI